MFAFFIVFMIETPSPAAVNEYSAVKMRTDVHLLGAKAKKARFRKVAFCFKCLLVKNKRVLLEPEISCPASSH